MVEGATSVTVTFDGETTAHSADVIGTNAAADVALVKARDVSGLPTVTFGSSSALQVGDEVVAIGDALDLDGGVT